MVDREPRVVIFACNWNAHESLQMAGREHLRLPVGARPLKVDCLGQVGAATILKALEKGADGVMLVGCTAEDCHYEFGSRRAAQLFEEAQELAALLGFEKEQMEFHQVRTGEGPALVEAVRAFVARIGGRECRQPESLPSRPAAPDPE